MHPKGHQTAEQPHAPSPKEKQTLIDLESAIENDIIILSTDPNDDTEDQLLSAPVIHHGRSNPVPIEGTRYKCAKYQANPHDRSHPLMKCPTPETLSNARRFLKNPRPAEKKAGHSTTRAHRWHSMRMQDSRHLVTETIVGGLGRTETKDEDIRDPEILSREGRRSEEAMVVELSTQMGRISVSYVLGDGAKHKHQQSQPITEEEEKKWSEYKHHHFVRRWGLLTEAEGRDEECDPGFLCEMCRHIDFKALFTQRGLPGNTAAGSIQIALHGLGHIFSTSIGFPKDDCRNDFDDHEFVLTFVIHLVNGVDDRADLGLLKSWIDMAEEPLQLRFIDLHGNRIVAPEVTPRIAQTQYTSATRSVLEATDGLCDPAISLPQTIRDAMQVAREIGLNYLWEKDVIENIARAGRIYSGLPGVSTGMCLATDSIWNSRAWTYQERQLSPRNVHFTESQMVLMSRDATFFEDTVHVMNRELKQSQILQPFNSNPRNVEWQVWSDPTERQYPNKAFETTDGIEDAPCPDPAPTYRITRLSGPELPGRLQDNAEGLTLWDRYAKAVSQYTKRNLTFDVDAVRAFSGMEYLIAKGVNTKFWYGVPEFALDRALLWYPNEPVERRKQGDRVLFPSWSWAAWKGHIYYKGKGWYNSQYHGPMTVIDWYQNMPREDFLSCYPVEPSSGKSMTEVIDELDLHRFLSPLNRTELLKLADADDDGWIPWLDKASNQHYYTHEAYPGVCFDYPVNLPDNNIIERPDTQGVLYFTAYTATTRLCDMSAATFTAEPPKDDFIQIGINDEERSANYRPSWKRILYHQGYRDTLPEIPSPGPKGALYRALDPRQVQYFIYKESREEEPLASYRPPDTTASPDADHVGEDGNPHWDQGRFSDQMPYPIYNVLLLKNTEDLWERVGVGKIHFHAFHLASPQSRLIYLA
ncbi:hypothetical protein BDV59DRAFT_192609 [Aspergillus ambiguus]|uniref:uncharacterized protein n=1 Tax=Aspergillus ambiguus TaxID=176160 RepID=UPI003CCD9ACA